MPAPRDVFPLVSIIVPAYNHEKFISETLESVLSQKYDNWECIIVNDGSTDATECICHNYQKNDNRFHYLFIKNSGPAKARNEGLKIAKGDFIQFLDSDDLLHPGKFVEQLAILQKNPFHDITYSEYACFYDNNFNEKWTYSRVKLNDNALWDFVANWERGLSIPIHCFLFRKSCFDRWGAFDKRFSLGQEDWDLYIRFANNGARFFFLPGVTAFYRIKSAGGGIARNKLNSRRFKKKLFKKYIFLWKLDFSTRLIFFNRYVRKIIYPALTKKKIFKTPVLEKSVRFIRHFFAK